jgi:hypothetical protein
MLRTGDDGDVGPGGNDAAANTGTSTAQTDVEATTTFDYTYVPSCENGNIEEACRNDHCWDYCKEEAYVCGTTVEGSEVWTVDKVRKDPGQSGKDAVYQECPLCHFNERD